jgi:hypothetical protein
MMPQERSSAIEIDALGSKRTVLAGSFQPNDQRCEQLAVLSQNWAQ